MPSLSHRDIAAVCGQRPDHADRDGDEQDRPDQVVWQPGKRRQPNQDSQDFVNDPLGALMRKNWLGEPIWICAGHLIQVVSPQLGSWSLIFLLSNAKQAQDELEDFADDEEEQGNDEADHPLLCIQWDRFEYPLQDA